jgi:CBS domain-containing protein
VLTSDGGRGVANYGRVMTTTTFSAGCGTRGGRRSRRAASHHGAALVAEAGARHVVAADASGSPVGVVSTLDVVGAILTG